MYGKTLNEMVDVVVVWAVEQGRKYPNGLESAKIKSNENVEFGKVNYPSEIGEFISTVKAEIAQMSDSSLRKFENGLLHVPEERGFTYGQISMLNAIRSAVFIEIENRQNKTEKQPLI